MVSIVCMQHVHRCVQTHLHIWMFCPLARAVLTGYLGPGLTAYNGLKQELVLAVSLVLPPAAQQLCPLLHWLLEPSLTFLFVLCKAGAEAAAPSSAHSLRVLRAKPCSAHVLTVISHR